MVTARCMCLIFNILHGSMSVKWNRLSLNVCPMSLWSPCYLIAIFTHSKLCLANAIHILKWVQITRFTSSIKVLLNKKSSGLEGLLQDRPSGPDRGTSCQMDFSGYPVESHRVLRPRRDPSETPKSPGSRTSHIIITRSWLQPWHRVPSQFPEKNIVSLISISHEARVVACTY